jgi:hypothetical protein
VLYGSDDPDTLRGIYLDGCVIDEVAQMHANLWGEIIRPTLTDRKGWVVFIGTPKGHNHFYDLWQKATGDEATWYSRMYRASETDVLDKTELELAKAEMSDEEYAQEFECSWTAAIRGAYYGYLIEQAEKAGRVTNVPYDPIMPVHTGWDLGIGDTTVIWFCQMSPGGELRIIDFYENSGVGLDHYVNLLSSKGYVYGKHLAPHDIKVRELGTGRSRLETAQSLGLNFEVVPNIPPEDGINAVRTILPRCWFDKQNTEKGLDCLRQYRREFNERMNTFRDRPLHDRTSHPADGFRYLAVGLNQLLETPKSKIPRIRSNAPQNVAWMEG